jgi:hypothetical protein
MQKQKKKKKKKKKKKNCFEKTKDVTHMLPSWPATTQAFTLIMSPRLRLRQFSTFALENGGRIIM